MLNLYKTAMSSFFILVFLLVCLTPLMAWSYDCNKHLESSGSDDRFDINADGTLTDINSGLTWMRCALGQSWNGVTCIGAASSYSWKDLNREIQKLNKTGGFASHTDWRLPKLPELASIVDIRCQYPRIDLTLFPNTPSATFWSADKKPGRENSIYILDFGLKGVSASETESQNHVRLVRGRD